MIELFQGDCLQVMKRIESNSIDLVLADPPYGTTACKWDSVINLDMMWEQLKRIAKDKSAVVMTCAQPFTSSLIMSNIKSFCYCWVWEKTQSTGHLNAYKMPMRSHEDIAVFTNTGKIPSYNPVIVKKDPNNIRPLSNSTRQSDCYGKHGLSGDTRKIDITEALPTTILKIPNDQNGYHPTQKPVKLGEYLIKTYSIQGQTVLDFCMGSGTFGISAKRNGRNFIGIEKDKEYFKIAEERIRLTEHQLSF